MAAYEMCPNCGNTEKGYSVAQCKRCGKMWCHRSTLFGHSGCSTGGAACQHCGRALGLFAGGLRILGTIS